MSKARKRNQFEPLAHASGQVMGGGVGLAALESMFNLVGSQSVLSAAMVRDHELSHPMMVQALALAVRDILHSEPGPCGPVTPAPGPDRPSRDEGDGDDDKGGVRKYGAGVNETLDQLRDELARLRGGADGDGGARQTTTTSKMSERVQGDGELHDLMKDMVNMLHDHLSDITKNTRQNLMVT